MRTCGRVVRTVPKGDRGFTERSSLPAPRPADFPQAVTLTQEDYP